MKKILFLTPQLPFPPLSGGTIKSWKLIEFLTKNYDTSLACFLKDNDNKYFSEFLEKVHLKKVYCQPLSVPRNIANLFKSYFYNIPLSIYRNYSKDFYNNILEIINDYDVIIVDHFLMFQYIPRNYKGKVILHEHNAEYIMWEKAALNERNIFKKIILYMESIRIKKYEKAICNRANFILAAPNDIENLLKLNIEGKKFYQTLHLGDENLLNQPDLKFENTEKSLLYIGTLSWQANIDGLLWFLKDCWGALKKMHKDLKLYIIGSNPPKNLENLTKELDGVIFVGFVENLEEYYNKCRVFISPLRFGSGIKVKNINAMYRGIPLVTTSIGSEGIDGMDMIHFSVANNSKDFVSKVNILLSDKVQWTLQQKESRSLMKKKYTWEIVIKNFKKAIDE